MDGLWFLAGGTHGGLIMDLPGPAEVGLAYAVRVALGEDTVLAFDNFVEGLLLPDLIP